MTKTYEIKNGGGAIKCKICGLISHNINDVKNKYCGYCHKFHEIYDEYIPENSKQFLS